MLEEGRREKVGQDFPDVKAPELPIQEDGFDPPPTTPNLGMGTAECLFGICIHLEEFTLPVTPKEVKTPK